MTNKMAKRDFPSTSKLLSTKKQKVDDIWDDDFDIDAIDDCFKRATQTLDNENKNDVTLATSYSIFKAPNQIFTSTQLPQSQNLEEQVKQLQEKYAEKEGEVAILRSNLASLRTTCQAEEERKQNEWKEKLSNMEKENKSIKSDLEFKNLEVANLKQQINELSKLVNNEVIVTQNRIVASPKKQERVIPIANNRIYVNVQKCYPLRKLNFSSVAKIVRSEKQVVCQQEFVSFIQESFPFLVQCSNFELNSSTAETHINQLLALLGQLLDTFHTYLKQPESYKSEELSFMCSDILEVVAETLCYSEHLQSRLLDKKANLILSIKNILFSIAKIKKEKTYAKFLSSNIKFLSETLHVNDFFLGDAYIDILDQFLVFNLDLEVTNKVIFFLNILSRSFSPFNGTTQKESCKFHKFFDVLENNLTKTQNAVLFIKITDNLLNLAYNLFRRDDPHQQDCDCCNKLYKLIVKCIYDSLDAHSNECCEIIPSFLKKCVNILALINFNAYDSTHKYVSDFAQFKAIVNKLVLLDAPNASTLEKLCSNEDLVSIESENFSNIDF